MVCLRNICINTLHKGDNDDNDDDDDDDNGDDNNKEMWVKLDNEHKYDHVPKWVEKIHEGKVTILWNQQVRTDRTIPDNKPDSLIRDNKQGKYILIDVANPGDINVAKEEAEKILKYKDLIIEIQRMWNVKAKVI